MRSRVTSHPVGMPAGRDTPDPKSSAYWPGPAAIAIARFTDGSNDTGRSPVLDALGVAGTPRPTAHAPPRLSLVGEVPNSTNADAAPPRAHHRARIVMWRDFGNHFNAAIRRHRVRNSGCYTAPALRSFRRARRARARGRVAAPRAVRPLSGVPPAIRVGVGELTSCACRCPDVPRPSGNDTACGCCWKLTVAASASAVSLRRCWTRRVLKGLARGGLGSS